MFRTVQGNIGRTWQESGLSKNVCDLSYAFPLSVLPYEMFEHLFTNAQTPSGASPRAAEWWSTSASEMSSPATSRELGMRKGHDFSLTLSGLQYPETIKRFIRVL